MFDLSSFELQKSIMNYNQKQMLEAEQKALQARKKLIENSIDALVYEYDRTYNTESSKVIDRKILRENAVISVVKNSLYGIFESALVLDESVKDEYKDNIKSLFETYFYQILKENNVSTLAQFKDFVKNSSNIIENVIERAETLVSMNEAVYTELLETAYNSTSLDNVIVNALQFISESDNPPEEKVDKAREVVDRLNAEFQRFTLEQRVASAHKIIQAAILILRLGVGIDKATYTVVDKLLSVVNTCFGRESTESLRDKLVKKTLKEVDSYYYTAIDVAITLKKLQKNYPEDSKEYLRVGERIVSIYKAIIIINQYRQSLIEKSEKKPLTEMSFVEFLTESDAVSMDSPIIQADIVSGLHQKMSATVSEHMVEENPYRALENIKLANRITSDPNYHHSFIDYGKAGSNVTLLIIKSLKSNDLGDKLRDQYMKEATQYSNNLKSVIETSRKLGRANQTTALIKQQKRLESFLTQIGTTGSGKKLIRESVSPLLSIDHKVGMDILASNILEATQFFELYEATAEDIKYVINLVEACDDTDEDVKDDLAVLARTAREAVDGGVKEICEQCACLEAAIYKKLYMANPNGISEAAGNELKQGKYPKLNDFLDDDEKNLIDSIVSASGKNKVVDTVKSKIIGVIDSEQSRIEKLEEEEQKLVSKLSKKIPEGDALQEAVQNRLGRSNGPANLFEAIVMNRSKKYIQEATTLGTGFDINMQKDTIMAEAITLYTIHETFNTLNFGKFDSSKINKLTNDYYHNKI